MSFIGVKDKEGDRKSAINDYCKACKRAKKDDCGKCDMNIYEVK